MKSSGDQPGFWTMLGIFIVLFFRGLWDWITGWLKSDKLPYD